MSGFSILQNYRPENNEVKEVAISGDMTISNAVETRKALSEALTAGFDMHLNLKGVTAIDLTGLQIICAAHITSIKLGRRFSIDYSTSGHFSTIIQEAGFLRHLGCSIDAANTCVWTGGENR